MKHCGQGCKCVVFAYLIYINEFAYIVWWHMMRLVCTHLYVLYIYALDSIYIYIYIHEYVYTYICNVFLGPFQRPKLIVRRIDHLSNATTHCMQVYTYPSLFLFLSLSLSLSHTRTPTFQSKHIREEVLSCVYTSRSFCLTLSHAHTHTHTYIHAHTHNTHAHTSNQTY